MRFGFNKGLGFKRLRLGDGRGLLIVGSGFRV